MCDWSCISNCIRSLRADLQQAKRADTERLEEANRFRFKTLVGMFYLRFFYIRSLRADLQQAHEAEIKSMLESTSAELQQTLQAKDSIIGGLQEQLDHLRKSHTAQVSHM